jgi:hypothetical protein
MTDLDKITNCVLNYVEGWYEGNEEKMKEALSKYLVKRRVVSENEIWDINKEWMINATKEGKGKIEPMKTAKKEITILDMTNKVATVKLLSNDFTDYLHLVKIDEKWEIVNVLWEYL